FLRRLEREEVEAVRIASPGWPAAEEPAIEIGGAVHATAPHEVGGVGPLGVLRCRQALDWLIERVGQELPRRGHELLVWRQGARAVRGCLARRQPSLAPRSGTISCSRCFLCYDVGHWMGRRWGADAGFSGALDGGEDAGFVVAVAL